MKMPSDFSKKSRAKLAKKESQKYPSFVGDLPVKIVQDIIDNLATNDDWETVAGKTGVSARAIASLKTRQHTKAEMANIIFEEWLCRIPRPVDLANLLLTVNRFADVKRLKTYISPEEWKGVERKIEAKTKAAPGRPSPAVPAVVSESRVTSVEESSVNYPVRSGRPSEQQSTAASSSITSHVSVGERRPVSERRQGVPSSIMSTTVQSDAVKPPSTSSPPRSSSFMSQRYDEELQEAQTCLTRYSVQFNFLDNLKKMPNCEHVSISPCNKWALKCLFGASETSDSNKKYYREVTALVRLRHVHIIPLSGYCIIDGDIHLVYPYLSAGTLGSQLTINASFKDYGFCIWTMLQVVSALCYVHAAGFMHGDISMSNILLDDQLHPYLADFEHSVNLRERHYDTNRETRTGTVPYMPPFSVPSPSPEVDIYAFGVLLALVSNQRVWKGGEERGAELVESLFQARTTPNLQRSHNLLRLLCLQSVQIRISHDWDMDEIEQQLMYVYQTVIEPEYEDPSYEFPDVLAEPYLVKKGLDERVGLKHVTDLQCDEDSHSDSDN